MFGGGEVAHPALTLRQRLIGDVTDEVLQEPVLTMLGRAWVGLERHHLLAHERREERIELRLSLTGESGKASACKCLAEHRSVLEQTPFVRGDVKPRRDQRVQRLGNLERVDRAHRPVHRTFLDKCTAVEQHAHSLDGVVGNTLRASKDLLA